MPPACPPARDPTASLRPCSDRVSIVRDGSLKARRQQRHDGSSSTTAAAAWQQQHGSSGTAVAAQRQQHGSSSGAAAATRQQRHGSSSTAAPSRLIVASIVKLLLYTRCVSHAVCALPAISTAPSTPVSLILEGGRRASCHPVYAILWRRYRVVYPSPSSGTDRA
jgi:hypothetical protein